MIKMLIIISLISSIISCELYDKLLDKVEESLDKQEVSIKSHDNSETDTITDIQDSNGITSEESGRSNRRARSLADDRGSEQEEAAVGGDVNGSRKDPGQVVSVDEKKDVVNPVAENLVSDEVILTDTQKDVLKQFDKHSKEAEDISDKVNSYLEVVGGTFKDLLKTKTSLMQ
ncbi:hypothetical protein DB313_05980 (plasmid) [Borrelia turcica IST7]|uniref:Uncharacterized protein n=1 Tax=Borrelia turcica IST7 TaxID=1104446 RepID=A0A386PRD5_9SPIR|nr:hypothetical protein [Borrelia turcica]AYE37050.1 hypothetical protein DB313_05980 [Borrelia turcica IST7]